MCTNIATRTAVSGSATIGGGWSPVTEATIGFDHATHLWREHAVRLDFVNAEGGERVAVELDLASGKALFERLREVIDAAERSGVET